MVDIAEVADGVYHLGIAVGPATTQLAAYLIPGPQGILVEPGPAAVASHIREGMERLGMKDLGCIIPTHVHVDHAGGTGTLARTYPAAQVLVHPAGLKHLIDPSRLIESTKSVWGEDFESRLGPVEPVPKRRITVPQDGQSITLNGRELRFIYTPGHCPHHMAIHDRSVNGVFCGEAVGLPGPRDKPLPMPAVAPPSFDQVLYLESMEKLRKLGARTLFFSHGGAHGDADAVISAAEDNTRLIGQVILEALKDGQPDGAIIRTVGDLVRDRFGMEVDETDLVMTVGGYTIYFRKSGLV
jgi:glyoxylase-like metal-dependent hydrolase (beta-lactamase superfamily II)